MNENLNDKIFIDLVLNYSGITLNSIKDELLTEMNLKSSNIQELGKNTIYKAILFYCIQYFGDTDYSYDINYITDMLYGLRVIALNIKNISLQFSEIDKFEINDKFERFIGSISYLLEGDIGLITSNTIIFRFLNKEDLNNIINLNNIVS